MEGPGWEVEQDYGISVSLLSRTAARLSAFTAVTAWPSVMAPMLRGCGDRRFSKNDLFGPCEMGLARSGRSVRERAPIHRRRAGRLRSRSRDAGNGSGRQPRPAKSHGPTG